ncbi:hypothetical protein EJ07DRAFT_180371 [Lizonia empirigonia]|nr:hypothetical protein EJ07DRAFT_180371 [Lizonia empirigonia]
MIWEWEAYTPGPEVYDNIWHIRQAPVTVIPQPSGECPIPDARTRILERRQTEDGFGRNIYFVEITYLGGQEPTSTWVPSSDNSERIGTEVKRVDLSRILQYVSPRELERFENAQFKIEADAQAVADKVEEDEQIQRRMEKNARMASSRQERENNMSDGLGIDPELQSTGRGRGNWRSRGSSALGGSHRELPQDEVVDSQPSQTFDRRTQRLHPEVAETDVESEELDSEDALPQSASPTFMRSAFVANSALPLSPVLPSRHALTALQRGHPEVPDIGDSDSTSVDGQDGHVSSAAIQFQFEGDFGDAAIAESESESVSSDAEDAHRSKRRRTESVEPQQELLFPPSSQIAESESSDDSNPADPPSTIKAPRHVDVDSFQPARKATSSPPPPPPPPPSPFPLPPPPQREEIDETPSSGEDEDTEEYVVESILQHIRYDEGPTYYLVKWEGYDDTFSWLPEENLEGAADVVAEYIERIRRKGDEEKAR